MAESTGLTVKTSEFIIKTNPVGYGHENNLSIFKVTFAMEANRILPQRVLSQRPL